jgi:peptidoglycan/LPS O-acetylase OafA/YrhL
LRHVGVVSALSLILVAATALPVQLRSHGIANVPVQYLGMHLSFLFLGLLLRMWLVEGLRGARSAVIALVVAQAIAVPSVAEFSMARGDNFIMEGLTPVLTAYLLAFVVFLAAVRFHQPRSMLLARIGLISYSMYLFHWCVNVVVYRFLPLTGQCRDIVTMLICTALTLTVSWLVYRMLERPMIMVGRNIVVRRGFASRS